LNSFNYSQHEKSLPIDCTHKSASQKQPHPICIFRKNPSTSLSSLAAASQQKFYPPQLEAESYPAIPMWIENMWFSKWVWIIWWEKYPNSKQPYYYTWEHCLEIWEKTFVYLLALPMDIVFRFIIEYSSSTNLAPR
jgi:hypothetical protein